MIWFDVKNSFINVPLEETIVIILKKIETKIPCNIMKELLYLYAKHIHFTYNDKIYIDIDGSLKNEA